MYDDINDNDDMIWRHTHIITITHGAIVFTLLLFIIIDLHHARPRQDYIIYYHLFSLIHHGQLPVPNPGSCRPRNLSFHLSRLPRRRRRRTVFIQQ